ncbi:MAG: hypothetical protein LBU79_07570, partial [Planctomycetota bacterium]|nr:hypothetical protein [Planctomycetota bacterium]
IPDLATDPGEPDTPPVTQAQLPLADREADGTESRDSGDKEATPPILDAPGVARKTIPDLATDPGEPDTPPVTQAQLPLADREADATESRDSEDKATPPILDAPGVAKDATSALTTDPGVQPVTPPVTQAQLPLADREADGTESRDSGDKATPPILDPLANPAEASPPSPTYRSPATDNSQTDLPSSLSSSEELGTPESTPFSSTFSWPPLLSPALPPQLSPAPPSIPVAPLTTPASTGRAFTSDPYWRGD